MYWIISQAIRAVTCIENVPDEIVVKCFEPLSIPEIVSCSFVSEQFFRVAHTKKVWEGKMLAAESNKDIICRWGRLLRNVSLCSFFDGRKSAQMMLMVGKCCPNLETVSNAIV